MNISTLIPILSARAESGERFLICVFFTSHYWKQLVIQQFFHKPFLEAVSYSAILSACSYLSWCYSSIILILPVIYFWSCSMAVPVVSKTVFQFSVYQSDSLPVCQSVSLPVCQSASLPVCQAVRLSVWQSVSLQVYSNAFSSIVANYIWKPYERF